MSPLILALALAQLGSATGGSLSPTAPLQLLDDGVKKGAVSELNFTGSAVACTRTGNRGTCDVTGGSGGANVVETSVALETAGYYTATVTGQAWVTASSVIVCAPFGTSADGLTVEAIAVSGINATASTRVAGVGFTLHLYSPNGLGGTVRIHCTGA